MKKIKYFNLDLPRFSMKIYLYFNCLLAFLLKRNGEPSDSPIATINTTMIPRGCINLRDFHLCLLS